MWLGGACCLWELLRCANIPFLSSRHEGASVWFCVAPQILCPTEEISTPPAFKVSWQVPGQQWAHLWHLLKGHLFFPRSGPWTEQMHCNKESWSACTRLGTRCIRAAAGFDICLICHYLVWLFTTWKRDAAYFCFMNISEDLSEYYKCIWRSSTTMTSWSGLLRN